MAGKSCASTTSVNRHIIYHNFAAAPEKYTSHLLSIPNQHGNARWQRGRTSNHKSGRNSSFPGPESPTKHLCSMRRCDYGGDRSKPFYTNKGMHSTDLKTTRPLRFAYFVDDWPKRTYGGVRKVHFGIFPL